MSNDPSRQADKKAVADLLATVIPNHKEIDAMTKEEVAEYLADSGVDVAKLRGKIAERKKELAGRFAMVLANRKRLQARAASSSSPFTEVPATREAIIAYFEMRFKKEEMPMAARKFKEADYEELRRLYLDLKPQE